MPYGAVIVGPASFLPLAVQNWEISTNPIIFTFDRLC